MPGRVRGSPCMPETVHARELADRWNPIEDEDRANLHEWVVAKVASITAEQSWAEDRYRDHVTARVGASLWPFGADGGGDRFALAARLIEESKAWPT